MSKAGSKIIKSAQRALGYVRGENCDGFIVHVPEEVDVKSLRKRKGLTQSEFALRFGFDVRALQDWEQKRRYPDRAARVLLTVIVHEPEAVAKALGDSDFSVVRYNSDGTLDTTFGTGGIMGKDVNKVFDDAGYSVVLQSDGKIIVSGSNSADNCSQILRYNADGSLDSTWQGQELPAVSNGELLLQLDTYNPRNGTVPSFYGSDSFTKETFSNDPGGVVFEIKHHFQTIVPGIVGGIFPYSANADSTHNEIDFEAVSNNPNEIQTNLYTNEPPGVGRHQFNAFSGSGALIDHHTYRIKWFKDAIRWLVDGKLVRMETNNIPQKPMALNFNVWAPGDGANGWSEAYSAAINPVTDSFANTSYYFNVDSEHIARLSSTAFFSTTDITPPIVTAITTDEGANGVVVSDTIVLTFSEAIQVGTGTIVIRRGSATGAVVESYDAAGSANLTISGNTLINNPTAAFETSNHYYVILDSGSVNNFSGNPFERLTTGFTTAAHHEPQSLTDVNHAIETLDSSVYGLRTLDSKAVCKDRSAPVEPVINAGSNIIKSAKRVLGYARGEACEGFVAHVPEEVDVKSIRKRQGLTQAEFSLRFGFDVRALQDWEQKRRSPERAARVLLTVIDHDPEAVSRAMAHCPEPSSILAMA